MPVTQVLVTGVTQPWQSPGPRGTGGDTEAGEWEREREAMPEVTGRGMGPSWLLVKGREKEPKQPRSYPLHGLGV